MKVSDLSGVALDYWVCRALLAQFEGQQLTFEVIEQVKSVIGAYPFHPSTNWAQGGPIIEREHIQSWHRDEDGSDNVWHAACPMPRGYEATEDGPTLLVAAMRAYVASKFGDDVPDEPM